MPTPEELQQDREFMQAAPSEQHAFLSQTDPDYAKASSSEQQGYLKHITATYAPPAAGAPAPPTSGYQSVPEESTEAGHKAAIRKRESEEGPLGQIGIGIGKAGGSLPFAESVPKMLSGDTENQDLTAHGKLQTLGKVGGFGAMVAPSLVTAPVATLGALGSGLVGQQIGKRGSQLLGASENASDVYGDIGGVAGGMLGSKTPTLRELRAWGRGNPDSAISEALHVGAKSPKMQAKLTDVEGARPYLKGAASQAEVQQRIPGAKAETWEPYQRALNEVGERTVQGPDGPTKVAALEQERLELSAKQQAWRKMTPTERQTALQKGEGIADLDARYQAVTSALDPALESTGIDPRAIRQVHGNIKGVERSVSGKSTIAEPMRPYGLQKMIPTKVPNPVGSEWQWQPIQGVKDIAAGRPLWKGRPTDVATKDLFSVGGEKPNLGTFQKPRVAGLLGPGARPMGSGMEPIGTPSAPEKPFMGTRAERFGRLLPEHAGNGQIGLREYGYSTPASQEVGAPGEQPSGVRATPITEPANRLTEVKGKPYYASTAGPQFPGRSVNEVAKIGNEKWTWNGKEWNRLGPPRK